MGRRGGGSRNFGKGSGLLSKVWVAFFREGDGGVCEVRDLG